MHIAGCMSVLEAEAVGVMKALVWLEEADIRQVTIENDSLLVAIRGNNNYQTEVGSIIDWCREKIRSRGDLTISKIS